ncbi:HemK methyltransferase member 2 [Clydaea vesicula]|uniref:HemK methyltransferase member 2 n=1 Tax=Clydaea vesicula TaxID=447962 RepID=A0AAD5Y0K4_9FUNG|nr:HemK methyltransferase member 2 [Clydaea vesicula]KAJ3388838.1 HemK methyltransferase member 2 [Lobulomyces angularis]
MFPTPDTSHLSLPEFKYNVYDPAEDTFLLLDTLESDLEYLNSIYPTICLEIGSGSGCVSSFLGSLLGGSTCLYLCTDINAKAAMATLETGNRNMIPLNPIMCDFSSALRLKNKIDVLIFNPPYVVTPSEEIGSYLIEAAWAGGVHGREVIDRFLPLVEDLLSKHGVFYLVVIEENRPDEIIKFFEKINFKCEKTTKSAGNEKLSTLKFFRR